MDRPVSVHARGIPLKPWAEASIHHHADELLERCPSLCGCDVVVSAPCARWRRAGGPYDILLRLERGAAPAVVVHPPSRERLDLAIDDAFALARLRLDGESVPSPRPETAVH